MSRGPYAAQPSARWRWLRRVPVLISGLWEALHTIFALFEFTDVILTLLSYCTNTVLLTLLLLGAREHSYCNTLHIFHFALLRQGEQFRIQRLVTKLVPGAPARLSGSARRAAMTAAAS